MHLLRPCKSFREITILVKIAPVGHATNLPDTHAAVGVTMDPLASMQLGHDHHATNQMGTGGMAIC